MKVEVKEENERSISFVLTDATDSEANAIRRACVSFVKVFAIDSVTVYENSSVMFDEYIAHRVGLVPIATPTKGYGDDDQILFTLEAEGPKTVYSSELKSSDKEVKVANGAIPLIKLAAGQRLRLEGKAVLGTAARHAKFQPGIVTYGKEGDGFKFYVETFGQMTHRQMINNGLDAIGRGLKAVSKQLK